MVRASGSQRAVSDEREGRVDTEVGKVVSVKPYQEAATWSQLQLVRKQCL